MKNRFDTELKVRFSENPSCFHRPLKRTKAVTHDLDKRAGTHETRCARIIREEKEIKNKEFRR